MLNRRLGSLPLIALIALAGPLGQQAAAGTLSIVTSEHTADWNPVNTHSYPALLVSRWIGERLYERKCRSRQGRIEEVMTHCQSPHEEPREGGKVRLDLSEKRCGEALGIDALSPNDISFTLDQIRRSLYNEYRHYRIRLTKAGILQLGDGDQGLGLAQLHKFDFPVLRDLGSESDSFHATDIDVDRVGYLNRHTAGRYRVNGIAPTSITLEARGGEPVALKRIHLTEVALDLDRSDAVNRDDPFDVVLAVPEDFPYPRQNYNADDSEDLTSFTYVGFNFAHKDFNQRNPTRHWDLIANAEFRELFTRSLWVIETLRDKLAIGQYDRRSSGVWLGESFDATTGDTVDLETRPAVEQQVQSFLDEQQLPRALTFRMLISPEIYKHFNGAEVDALVADLEAIWSPDGVKGLRINPIKRDTAAEFARAKDAKNYHLIFDDFMFGRNVHRQLAFVDPRNQGRENFLGIELFDSNEIDAWLSDSTNGMVRFREAVAKRYPVAVVGHFPRRDLFLRSVDRGEPDCGTALPMPFFNIASWKVP